MTAHATIAPPAPVETALQVLGLAPDRPLTARAVDLFNRAAGDKLRLARVVAGGSHKKAHALSLLGQLRDAVTLGEWYQWNNGGSTLGWFLNRHAQTIDAVCSGATFAEIDDATALYAAECEAVPHEMSEWEIRYRQALGSPSEAFLLRKLASELEAEGEPIWTVLFDLANGEFDDDRSEALADIEAAIEEWKA